MKKYGKFAALIVVVIGTLVWLATAEMKENQTYYKTITELGQMGDKAYNARIRVGRRCGNRLDPARRQPGASSSWRRRPPNSRSPTPGTDPLPDTFKDGAQALADGKLGKDGVFRGQPHSGQVRLQV